MNGKDLVIGVLSVTAVVLLAALMLIYALTPPQAMAFGQTAQAGPYIAATAQLDEFGELLLIIDTNVDLMNAYLVDPVAGRIELVQQVDLMDNPAAMVEPPGR